MKNHTWIDTYPQDGQKTLQQGWQQVKRRGGVHQDLPDPLAHDLRKRITILCPRFRVEALNGTRTTLVAYLSILRSYRMRFIINATHPASNPPPMSVVPK